MIQTHSMGFDLSVQRAKLGTTPRPKVLFSRLRVSTSLSGEASADHGMLFILFICLAGIANINR